MFIAASALVLCKHIATSENKSWVVVRDPNTEIYS